MTEAVAADMAIVMVVAEILEAVEEAVTEVAMKAVADSVTVAAVVVMVDTVVAMEAVAAADSVAVTVMVVAVALVDEAVMVETAVTEAAVVAVAVVSVVVTDMVVEDAAVAIDLPHEEDLEVLQDMTVTVVHDHAVDKFSKTAMFSLIFAKIEFSRFSFSPSSVKFRVVSISNCFRSPAWSRYSCSKKNW